MYSFSLKRKTILRPSYPTEETTEMELCTGPKAAHLARKSLTEQHQPEVKARDSSW